jgi:hypothetical protein
VASLASTSENIGAVSKTCVDDVEFQLKDLVSPAEFHEWNPSVGLDCTPWWDWQSYCVVTQKKLDSLSTTTPTPSATISSTTTASSLGPSPTAWDPIRCYAQNPDRNILEQNMNPNGDGSLTIPKCKLTCYRRAYTFAGVLQGNQCWCSNYVAGEWAKKQTDCNAPCAGDKSTVCGGTGVFNVFEALANSSPAVISSAAIKSAKPVEAAASSNGAMSNRAVFGMDF